MPKIEIGKLLVSDDVGSSPGSVDPAEESLLAAKNFTKNKKRQLKEEKETSLDTTEDDWYDNGGAIHEIDDEEEEKLLSIEDVEEIKKLANIAITLPYNPPEHPLYQKYNNLLTELKELRDKKGKDYGTLEDPFANIRGSKDFGIKAWVGAAKQADDCMTRIAKYAREGNLTNDNIRDVFLDLANYSIIMTVLWEEENENKNS